MLRLILIGLLSGFFFSSTFVLNRMMSLQGGHWVWTASLRYGYMIIFLMLWVGLFRGFDVFKKALRHFYDHWLFWTLTGSVGFGGFYALICYSADYAPGWVIATTWQFTIIATLIVLICFGRSFPKRIWLFSCLVFAGVLMVNLSRADAVNVADLVKSIIPVLIAAFCYPIGNQLVWEATNGNQRLPDINTPVIHDPFIKVLLMSLGSAPLWLFLVIVNAPPLPSKGQLVSTALVALSSGVVATSIFLYARNLSQNAAELAAVDSTQSSEVIFALVGEMVILGAAFPNIYGVMGILITGVGLVAFVRHQGAVVDG